jgi:DNA-binding response OmpR family regulator
MLRKRSRSEKDQARGPGGEGVLLVCDDPDAGELLARLITKDGHDLQRVETAEGALRHLLATPRAAGVLSLSGPTANRQLIEEIRSHPSASMSEVALLALTDDEASAEGARMEGADAALARPFHAAELTAELTAVIAARGAGS